MIPERNKIICGDVLEVLRTFDDCIFDLVITSPPYNLGGTFHSTSKTKSGRVSTWIGGYDTYHDNMDEEEYQLWQIDVMNELYRVTKDDGNFFYNHKNRISEGVLITPYSWILKTNWIVRQEIVWDTTNIVNPDDRRFLPIHEQIYWLSKTITRVYNNTQRFSDCWVFRNNLTRRETGHPATFPIEIVIRILSVLPDAKLVLDPFMGSGTTAVACVENNRDFVGIEISERYVDTASERIKLSAAQGMLF